MGYSALAHSALTRDTSHSEIYPNNTHPKQFWKWRDYSFIEIAFVDQTFEKDMESLVMGNSFWLNGRWHQEVSRIPVHIHKSGGLCLEQRISNEEAPGKETKQDKHCIHRMYVAWKRETSVDMTLKVYFHFNEFISYEDGGYHVAHICFELIM